MEIIEVDWAEGVREKIITKHRLDPEEVEDSFFEPRLLHERGRSGRYLLWTQSPAGAYICGVRVREGQRHGHHGTTHE